MASLIEASRRARAGAPQVRRKAAAEEAVPEGHMPLSGPMVSVIQKELISLEDSMDQLADLADTVDDDYLTLSGQVGLKISRFKDYVGIAAKADKDKLKRYTEFRNRVNFFFNQYRKVITGSQASFQELEALKTSILNEDLTPAEFEGAFKTAMDNFQRGIAAKRKLLSQGIDTSTVSKETYGELFDKTLQETPSFLEDQPDDQADNQPDFKYEGLSDQEVLDLFNQ